MNNSKRRGRDNWKSGGGGGGKGRNNRRSEYGHRYNNNSNERNDRKFPKFADNDYSNRHNEKFNPFQIQNNSLNNNNDRHQKNHLDGGIVPWHRKTPIIPLVIPPQMPVGIGRSHDKQEPMGIAAENAESGKVVPANNDKAVSKKLSETEIILNTSIKQEQQHIIKPKQERKSSSSSSSESSSSESSSSEEMPDVTRKVGADEIPKKKKISEESPATSTTSTIDIKLKPKSTVVNETPKKSKGVSKELPVSEVDMNSLIKQESQHIIKPKQERKSSSSSSSNESSSSESYSSQKTPEVPRKPSSIEIPMINKISGAPPATITTSTLNIKLKAKDKVVNEVPTSKKAKKKAANTSSSSSEEEEEPTKEIATPSKSATKAVKTKLQNQETKTKSAKKKSEDDVIFIGNLENKIVLDDSDQMEEQEIRDEATGESTDEDTENKISKKSVEEVEKCMICDKKGHTSFQCLMICKNCSEPYHGYRTCPHPANLNTMLQLFLEFCMQQFQHFDATKDININSSSDIPKPRVDSHMECDANTINTLKRKRSSAKITKSSSAKKHSKSSRSRKNIKKEDSFHNENEDSDSSSSSSESEEDAAESDNPQFSKRSFSSKKKLKLKNQAPTQIPFNVPGFTANPLNLPLVLNGLQNLTAEAAAPSNSSNNALNTLLLTQMFQNAISSLK